VRTLRTIELTKAYRGRKVVDNVSVWVKQGEVVGVLGPNGAGKTTSFYMIVGLITPDSGRVMLDDEDITPLAMYQRARRGISYLPQEASVFRKLSVENNLMAILQTLPDLNRRERRERMNRLIDQLGLETVRHSKGYVLSGGERRRVEIARSLVIEPSFLLLDEPFSGIDPIQVLELQKIIFDLKRAGIGIW
jgi:lipopolysaccharide export system ATP-binding protein